LRDAIHDYKYGAHAGWARVFARLLLAWLDLHCAADPPDLIVANPTHNGGDGRGHTERVLAVARGLDREHRWALDSLNPPALVKTTATPRSAAGDATDKRAVAVTHRKALSIPTPHRIRGRRVLVYDDVATTGYQLDAVAGFLLDDGGAAQVRGVVLARAPWGA
jgi:predicted amidophosphoribosyltransferase